MCLYNRELMEVNFQALHNFMTHDVKVISNRFNTFVLQSSDWIKHGIFYIYLSLRLLRNSTTILTEQHTINLLTPCESPTVV